MILSTKEIGLFGVFLLSAYFGFTQQKDIPKTDAAQILSGRPKDHLQFQLGTTQWMQRPDSVVAKGLSRCFNAYFSFDLPFKTDPRFSIGIGGGVGSDRVFFDPENRRELEINGNGGIRFRTLTGSDTTIRYKSIALHTAFLEAPIELRFMNKPQTPNKSWKLAIGMKVGTLITAVDKTRYERDAQGNRNYNSKIKDRKHFNTLRLAACARISYGIIGLFVQYQLNDLIKEGQGPNQIRPLQAGITVSGL
jgi:hypothetical protein